MGAPLGWVAAVALVAWVATKYLERWRFLRDLRTARVSPEEVKKKLDAGEALLIVDLRSALDFAAEPGVIPGALRIDAASAELSVHLELVRGARSSSTARDRTRPRAPVWRSVS